MFIFPLTNRGDVRLITFPNGPKGHDDIRNLGRASADDKAGGIRENTRFPQRLRNQEAQFWIMIPHRSRKHRYSVFDAGSSERSGVRTSLMRDQRELVVTLCVSMGAAVC